MRYRGKYRVSNPRKYKGDPRNVVYRSSWEYKFMQWCESSPSVEEWSSEEFIIPYISPVDGKRHRYFPDFYVKVKENTGKVKKMLIEVKPLKQTMKPKKPKRQTKGYLFEVYEYAKNQAKWKAADNFCKDRSWEFKVMTEKELGIKCVVYLQ